MKYTTKLLIILLVLIVFPQASHGAKKVAVVLSNDHVMYENIYEKFRRSSVLKGVIVKKYILQPRASNTYIRDAIKGGNFDAAFTIGTGATKMLKEMKTIPAIYSMVVNPKYFGFLGKDETSLPNLSGISIEVPIEEQFRLLRKILPQAKKIGVIYDPSKSGYTIARAVKASMELDLEVFEVPVKSSPEVPNALTRLESHMDVLFAIVDDTVYKSSTMGHILLRCLKKKIPVFGFSHTITRAGAVFSTYIDFDSIGEVGAERVRLILDGTSCEKIPFLFTNRWKFSVNLTVAQRLGIEISDSILE
ncbi:hypothetical protein KA005_77415, partial [bacterium]|nr:hypothetical protein [bacterium]